VDTMPPAELTASENCYLYAACQPYG